MNRIIATILAGIVINLAAPLILMPALLAVAILAVGAALGGDVTTERIEEKDRTASSCAHAKLSDI